MQEFCSQKVRASARASQKLGPKQAAGITVVLVKSLVTYLFPRYVTYAGLSTCDGKYKKSLCIILIKQISYYKMEFQSLKKIIK